MRSEALDIAIETRAGSIRLELSGSFHNEQIPNIREKIRNLIDDDNRSLIIDLDGLTLAGDGVALFFLGILNAIKAKGGDLKLVYRNEAVSRAFAPYRHLFAVYPDMQAACDTLAERLRRRTRILSRKTGVRLSRPVAIFVLVVLCGWFLSLVFILHLQNRRIHEQETVVRELTSWKQKTLLELTSLRERLRPMEQLGIVSDTTVLHSTNEYEPAEKSTP